MRLLISFIVLCVAFTPPLAVSARDINKLPTGSTKKQSAAASFVSAIAEQELEAVVKPTIQVVTVVERGKTSPFANFITAVAVSTTTIIPVRKKHFVDRYTDHQPIALKLLFPKHYFW